MVGKKKNLSRVFSAECKIRSSVKLFGISRQASWYQTDTLKNNSLSLHLTVIKIFVFANNIFLWQI